MTAGGALYFRTLVEYVGHFTGRSAVPVTAFGPPVADWDRLWAFARRTRCTASCRASAGRWSRWLADLKIS
jgi:hypothetical protein